MTTAREAQVARDARYDELQAQIKGKVCATCDTYPRVASLAGNWIIRCDCYPGRPVLASEYQRTVGRRQWDMTTKALARLDEHGIKAVNAELMTQEVKALLPGAQRATTNELQLFVRFCQSLGANPFIGEVYLVKYQASEPASIVVGLGWRLKQAARNPDYQGYKAGLILQGESGLEYREGSMALDGERVVGGWCDVYRKGWVVAPRHTVSMKEYNSGMFVWKNKPNTMIEKVAINQAIRRAFPEEASETERSVATASMRVLDEGQAGVDLDDRASSLSDDPVVPMQRTEAQAPTSESASPAQAAPPTRTARDASNDFWPRVREQHPQLDSQAVLAILKVKMFTEWRGTVDDALAAVTAAVTAKAPVKAGG